MRYFSFALLSAAFCLLINAAWALASGGGEVIASIRELTGEVLVSSGGETRAAVLGQDLMTGDRIQTGPTGQVVIAHAFGFTSTLEANSQMRVSPTLGDIARATLVSGCLRVAGALKGKSKDFSVSTPVGVLGIRGTAFLAVGATDGASLVSVQEGTVSAGIGRDVVLVSAGSRSEGGLVTGYGTATSGEFPMSEAMLWRAQREKDLSARVQQVLAELARLQQQEDEDWRQIQAQVQEVTLKTVQGTATEEDRFFFRRILDIEDRMSARMLLAIQLREWAGITPAAEAESERIRADVLWKEREWRRQAMESATQGKAISGPVSEGAQRYFDRAKADDEAIQGPPPSEVPVRKETAALFPSVVPGLYLGMTPEELKALRPNAMTTEMPGMPAPADMPVVYQEKQLSGGDWSREGWFTGMYTFYRGRMIQAAFLAFSGTEKIRGELVREWSGLYGRPWRFRLEPDWAQAGVIKGTSVEWKADGVDILLISRNVAMLQGNTRGLELRLRLSGFDPVLESRGQFNPVSSSAEIKDQLAKDFPEITP